MFIEVTSFTLSNAQTLLYHLTQVLDNIGFHWGRYTEYRMRPEKNRMSVALGVANPIFFMVEFDIQCIARNKASNIIIIMFLKSDLTQKLSYGLKIAM